MHLSKVRSANLDTWLPEQVAFVAAMGNGRAAIFWEARLPPNFERPRDGDMRALSVFINQKWVSLAAGAAARDMPRNLIVVGTC